MSVHTEEHQSFQDEAKRETALLVGISRAIEASPVKHQGTREEAVRAILSKLNASHTLRISDRGWLTVIDRSGNPADFAKLVTDAMLLDRNIGDPVSIAAAVKAGTVELGAKDELSTPAQKVAFISKFGGEAWAKLPTHRSGPTNMDPATMTKADYNKMSVKQKIAFQKTIDETTLGAILSRR
jgi:hypothetical protein